MTYIFENYTTVDTFWCKNWILTCTILGDSHSQLLQIITKMSPDGANFLLKSFQGSGQYPCKTLASQLFSVQRYIHLTFSDMMQNLRSSSAELRIAEKLTFCMDPTLTPRNICAKNQRHLHFHFDNHLHQAYVIYTHNLKITKNVSFFRYLFEFLR